MDTANVDGILMTADEAGKRLDNWLGYSVQAELGEGCFRLKFTWTTARPTMKADRLIVDRNLERPGGRPCPYLMLIAFDSWGVKLLHSHHICNATFRETNVPTAEIIDIIDGVETRYSVPLVRIMR